MKVNNIICSVIVPIYNAENYLRRCLDSLINQTEQNIEIILVNDGSKDASQSICIEYEKIDSRITVIHKTNGGLSDARNEGLKNCKGKYVLFIDSDDWCDSYMIEDMCSQAELGNLDVVISGYYIKYYNNYTVTKEFDIDKVFLGNKEIKEAIYIMDSKRMFNVVWNKLYKRSILHKKGIYFDKNGMPGEDLIFNCEYFKFVDRICFLKKNYYNYMREESSTLVSKYREDLYDKVNKFNCSRKKLYEFYDMLDHKYEILLSNLHCEYIFSCIPNVYRKNCNITVRERKNLLKRLLLDEETKKLMKFYNPTSFQFKLFKILYKFDNTEIMYLTYSILFKLRYRMNLLYKIFRNQINY